MTHESGHKRKSSDVISREPGYTDRFKTYTTINTGGVEK